MALFRETAHFPLARFEIRLPLRMMRGSSLGKVQGFIMPRVVSLHIMECQLLKACRFIVLQT